MESSAIERPVSRESTPSARASGDYFAARTGLGYSGRVKHPGLLSDILFKIVFGTESSEPTLRALLNALLDLSGPQRIVDLVLVNPISEKQYIDDKGPILDVKAVDGANRQYNIEVQLSAGVGDYINRSVYYTSRFFSEQLKRGDSYHGLAKTISISLLDFILFVPNETHCHDSLHTVFCLKEKTDGFVLSDALELHYIELRKFKPSKPEVLQTRFERWLYFLKFSDTYGADEVLPENLAQEEGISMALESMRRAYSTDLVRELIEAREKAERDEINRIYHATKEGHNKGLLTAARGMLTLGLSPDLIKQATGLTHAEIAGLERQSELGEP